MSLGKPPGFKGMASGPQGKRHMKSELSVDMISPPMPDFRHTMHVGRGGDVFGDTSFLSDHGGRREEPAGSPDGFFSRTFRHVRRNPEPRRRRRAGSRELSSPPPPSVSPIIKNAVSLPQLNLDAHNGGLQRALFPTSASTYDAYRGYGLQSGFVTLPRGSRLDRGLPEGNIRKGSLADSGGGLTPSLSDSLTDFTDFTFDLGPSLMSEILSLIDRPSGLSGGGPGAEGQGDEDDQEEEEEEDEGDRPPSVLRVELETPTGTPTATPTSARVGSGSSVRTERVSATSAGGGGGGGDPARTPPDASCRSPQGAEPGMGAERFQRASSVLSRHYGGGSFSCPDDASPPPSHWTRTAAPLDRSRTQGACAEEEEVRV